MNCSGTSYSLNCFKRSALHEVRKLPQDGVPCRHGPLGIDRAFVKGSDKLPRGFMCSSLFRPRYKCFRSISSQLSCSRSHDCIVRNMRVASVRAAGRKLVKLFKKPKSKFYWYDFTARGRRYRASTQETKSVRAQQIGLAVVVIGCADCSEVLEQPNVGTVLSGDFQREVTTIW